MRFVTRMDLTPSCVQWGVFEEKFIATIVSLWQRT